ncbi:hypothetical protein SETIT_6G017900v2 [Setaria italica]|uniref:Uncharacterized protein n=1 Tax=Setaria italica TaxID=4555 RepID=A0A368RHF7_SETIT|nr:hypothetical protein SETIT_6G017900v2 [Setaria italica]
MLYPSPFSMTQPYDHSCNALTAALSGGYHCCLHHRFPMTFFDILLAYGNRPHVYSNIVFVLQGKVQINGFYDSATSPHHATWLGQELLLLYAWIYGDKHLALGT